MRRTVSAAAVAMIDVVAWGLAVLGRDDPAPPDRTYEVVVIHPSCGENGLAHGDGGLGRALADHGDYVSGTSYGRGPVCEDCEGCRGAIGDCTDIVHWVNWLGVPDGEPFTALLHTFDQHADYRRGTDPDPNRKNEIILFTSCYPNSSLAGRPEDPTSEDDDGLTVDRAQAVYLRLLESFAGLPRQAVRRHHRAAGGAVRPLEGSRSRAGVEPLAGARVAGRPSRRPPGGVRLLRHPDVERWRSPSERPEIGNRKPSSSMERCTPAPADRGSTPRGLRERRQPSSFRCTTFSSTAGGRRSHSSRTYREARTAR